MTKSNNGHFVYVKAGDYYLLVSLKHFREGKIDQFMGRKEIANVLENAAEGAWDNKFGEGYWAHSDTNLLIENTKGVQKIRSNKRIYHSILG